MMTLMSRELEGNQNMLPPPYEICGTGSATIENSYAHAGSEVLTAVTLNNVVFWFK
jgi:hypothetical protein